MKWDLSLFQILSMSNVPWDDVMEVLRQFQSLVLKYDIKPIELMGIFTFMHARATSYLLPFDHSDTSRDLARAFLRIVKDLGVDRVLFKSLW
jgi:hypothetical protein